jgi:hypothetical protein
MRADAGGRNWQRAVLKWDELLYGDEAERLLRYVE